MLKSNNLVILEGETGSGKSTQLPQLLCQYYQIFENEGALPVLITQPRKLATRTLAERVAFEMEETVHQFVDYQTSLNSRVSPKAKIVFKLDRLVLDELRIDPKLSKYSCLVIDQAHERTISIDVILGLVKDLLKLRPQFRIIITSASMDTQLFHFYFKKPILKVSGRIFPVTQLFYPYSQEKDSTRKIIKVIEQQLLDQNQRNLRPQFKGHILAFCSGIDQIDQLCKYFNSKLNPACFKVLPLHGRLSIQQQKEVFADLKISKVIFATRIAQTSITIDKIKVVIDTGEDREMIYDQKTKISTMKLKNISQSSAKQRAGRAGRTNKGYCFRLYTNEKKVQMNPNQTPQMKKMALDTVVLRLKSLQIDIEKFEFIEPPDKQSLSNSIQAMKLMGCIDRKSEKITRIGEFLLKIPIQPFLARAIVEAIMVQKVIDRQINKESFKKRFYVKEYQQFRKCRLVQDIIGILCMVVNASNLFFAHEQDWQTNDMNKFQQFADERGDFFFLKKIYQKYKQFEKRPFLETRKWAKQNFLNIKSLKQSNEAYWQISKLIKSYEREITNNITSQAECRLRNVSNYDQLILSCLVSSFSINIAIFSKIQQVGYTIISQDKNIQIYGSSSLGLQGISPSWILFYDLFQNDKGKLYCKIANAIDYKFLLQNTSDYMRQKYDLKSLKDFNPYYERDCRIVPSLLYFETWSDYKRKDDKPFLQHIYINFFQDRNQLDIYFKSEKNKNYLSERFGDLSRLLKYDILKKESYKDKKNPKDIIYGYLKDLENRFSNPFNYNYVNRIFLQLNDGFVISKLVFKQIVYTFKIDQVKSQDLGQFIIIRCQSYCDQFELKCSWIGDKIIFQIYNQDQSKTFKAVLQRVSQELRNWYGVNINHSYKQLPTKKKKVAELKCSARFWVSENNKKDNRLFIDYSDSQHFKKFESIDAAEQWVLSMKEFIQQYFSKYQALYYSKIHISNRKTGINIFNCHLDEIQLAELLKDLQKQYFQFYMPPYITKYRTPDLQLSAVPQKYWEEKIKNLLAKEKINVAQTQIRLWGKDFYSRDQANDDYSKRFKVDWFAQIKSSEGIKLENFMKAYDRKLNVLGSEKFYIQGCYSIVAAVVSQKAFNALSGLYNDYVKYLNQKIRIETQNIFKKNKVQIKIQLTGPNRQVLLEPARRFQKLFTCYPISIDQKIFRFFDQTDEGNKVLQQIQEQYEYDIYFSIDKQVSQLKVYCLRSQLPGIQSKIKERLKEFNIFEQQISYKGKNLNIIKGILDKMVKTLKNSSQMLKFFNYEIIFKYRKVRLLGDAASCDQAANQILKIANKQKSNCQICYQIVTKPYRLFCKHQFCWDCVSSHITDSARDGQDSPIGCPVCEKSININDIKKLLPDHVFHNLCKKKVKKFIEKNKQQYHQCLTNNCQNIFHLQETIKANFIFDCEVCGTCHCFKCKKISERKHICSQSQ